MSVPEHFVVVGLPDQAVTVASRSDQLTMSFGSDGPEDPDYLSRQLITYIGNKRGLIEPIRETLDEIHAKLGRNRLRTLDPFSGSGAVSRLLKQYSSEIVTNDIERYAATLSRCFLSNRSETNLFEIQGIIDDLNAKADTIAVDSADGFIRRLYAPENESKITVSDRVFYTIENAARIDFYRAEIDNYPADLRPFLLAPLLSSASIHANTAGVFKGFYKDRRTGIGQYGGSGADALSRIKAPIRLSTPTLSEFECAFQVFTASANDIASDIGEFDIAYLDPPYNQHPYGSNYFMLNLIDQYAEPFEISSVSGIPTNWTRSEYNVRKKSATRLAELISKLQAKFVVLSFNDEGFVTPEEVRDILADNGDFREVRTKYNTFRGSRNLANRSLHVTEHLYILKK